MRTRLGRLTVRLELDPSDYDDETLAILWASRIREAVIAAGVAIDEPDPIEPADAPSAEPPVPPTAAGVPNRHPGEVPALARAALRGDAGARSALARAIVADGRAIARALESALGRADRERLLDALTGATGGASTIPEPPGPVTDDRAETATGAGLGAAQRMRRRRPAPEGSWPRRLAAAARRNLAAAGLGATTDSPLRPRAGRPSPRPGRRNSAEPAQPSALAGIPLLWPWLAEHLSAAVERMPGLDPIDARRIALAGLVPDRATAVDDPVVRLLAGDDLGSEPSLVVVGPDEQEAAIERSEAVLAAFAAALPGFAASTPGFIRREFLVRPGVVERDAAPILVRLGRLPLDPILTRLPYPVGVFRLPWTPPIRLLIESD